VLLDGKSWVNIIIKYLITRLKLLRPKPTPYNLRMEDQKITKSIGLIKDLKMYVLGTPYITNFIVP